MAYVQSADPDSVLATVGLAMLEQYAGRYDQSIRLIESRGKDSPAFEPATQILAGDYLAEKKDAKAIEILSTAPRTPDNADGREALLAVAYAKAGQTKNASDSLDKTLVRLHQGSPLAYDTALIYASLGNNEKALDMLQIAFDDRESILVFVNVDPLLASLRTEERFHKLIKQMKLQ
jgi:tetratricopeptide (TPR) repeat protein